MKCQTFPKFEFNGYSILDIKFDAENTCSSCGQLINIVGNAKKLSFRFF